MKKIIIAMGVAMLAVTLGVSAAPPESTETTVCITEAVSVYTPTQNISDVVIPQQETPAVVETTSSTESETISYYNVNLSTEIQDVIFAECEKYNIPPQIVIAMIERESRFIPHVVGDNGNSFGLMQIQPRWHSGRMARLGCTDLLDPVQNVIVGIDLLGELYIRYNDIGLALTAYNSGSANNGYNGYAIAVMARANEV